MNNQKIFLMPSDAINYTRKMEMLEEAIVNITNAILKKENITEKNNLFFVDAYIGKYYVEGKTSPAQMGFDLFSEINDSSELLQNNLHIKESEASEIIKDISKFTFYNEPEFRDNYYSVMGHGANLILLSTKNEHVYFLGKAMKKEFEQIKERKEFLNKNLSTWQLATINTIDSRIDEYQRLNKISNKLILVGSIQGYKDSKSWKEDKMNAIAKETNTLLDNLKRSGYMHRLSR